MEQKEKQIIAFTMALNELDRSFYYVLGADENNNCVWHMSFTRRRKRFNEFKKWSLTCNLWGIKKGEYLNIESNNTVDIAIGIFENDVMRQVLEDKFEYFKDQDLERMKNTLMLDIKKMIKNKLTLTKIKSNKSNDVLKNELLDLYQNFSGDGVYMTAAEFKKQNNSDKSVQKLGRLSVLLSDALDIKIGQQKGEQWMVNTYHSTVLRCVNDYDK